MSSHSTLSSFLYSDLRYIVEVKALSELLLPACLIIIISVLDHCSGASSNWCCSSWQCCSKKQGLQCAQEKFCYFAALIAILVCC